MAVQYDLNVRDYVRIFHKHKFAIVFIFVIVTLSSVMFLSKQSVIYTTDVTIKIEEGKTIAGLLTEWIMYNPGDAMESHTKIIKGFPVMKKVGVRLGMLRETDAIDKVSNVVRDLQGRVETERVGATNMIRIIALASEPEATRKLANTIAEVYIEENLLEKGKQVRHVRQFVEQQLQAIEDRLRKAEEHLKDFGEGSSSVKLYDPVQQKLVSLEFQLAEMLQKYTDKHPKIIQIKEQIKNLESQITNMSTQELAYSRVMREIEVNKKLYSMLSEKLEEARISEAQKVSDISIVNPAFLPSVPISGNRNMKIYISAFIGLLLGFVFAFVFEAMDSSISTIEDVERVIKLPVLGVIPNIEEKESGKKEFYNPFRKKEKAIADKAEESRLKRLIVHYQPQSPVAEAYRNIYSNLKLDGKRKVLMITSSGTQEGKSTVSVNLSLVMAQTGLKTVIVSGDLRRPVIAKTFGIIKDPGLSEYLSNSIKLEPVLKDISDLMLGDMDLEDIRKTPGLENITIINSGKLPSNPVKLLGGQRLLDLIETLRQRFDIVIFDSPPVLPVADSCLLAPKVDAVILVYEIGRTSREALIRTKIQLETVGANIVGIVLNNTQSQSEAIGPYPYYYHYKYRYYRKEELPEKEKIKTVKDKGRKIVNT